MVLFVTVLLPAPRACVEIGSPLASQAASCSDQDELMLMAQHGLQLWECKRLQRCSKLPQGNSDQQLLAALCVLRLQTGQGPGQPWQAAQAASAGELQPRYGAAGAPRQGAWGATGAAGGV